MLWDFHHLYEPYTRHLQRWWAEGLLVSREHIHEGIESAAAGMLEIFDGKNFGKALCRVGDDPYAPTDAGSTPTERSAMSSEPSYGVGSEVAVENGGAAAERLEMARWTLARRPASGTPAPSDFRLERDEIPEPGDREVLIRTLYISMDPHTRAEIGTLATGVSARVQQATLPLLDVGGTIPGYAVGEVLRSRDPALAAGDVVRGYWGWRTHVIGRFGGTDDGGPAPSQDQVQEGSDIVFKVDSSVRPVSRALHMLGEMGLTAYVALTAIGQPRQGEVVFVSSAAGTVGAVAGQTAKNLGCRVVGSVGSEAKARYIVDELGFDAAVIRQADDVEAQLDAACPDGIDVYFDNVGGVMSDMVVARLRSKARVVLVGATADWNAGEASVGPRIYWPLLVRRARVEGFILWDHECKYAEGFRQLATWAEEGRMTNAEQVLEGFDNVPTAFIDFLDGRYHGKVLVRVAQEPEART